MEIKNAGWVRPPPPGVARTMPVVKTIISVNQTKEIWRDFTRFAIISKPKIQFTQNKNHVEANYIAYHISVNFFKTDIQLSQKKCYFHDALLLTHAVVQNQIQKPKWFSILTVWYNLIPGTCITMLNIFFTTVANDLTGKLPEVSNNFGVKSDSFER